MECLATKLLSRGDTVSIEQGRLIIQSASGKPVPVEWLIESTPEVCRAILKESGLDAFEYVSYHTGHYGKHKAPGVTLQFVSVLWSTKSGHWFRFIGPLIRHQLAFCIRCSCVVADGCSNPSDSAARPPQLGLGWHSRVPASTPFSSF